MTSSSSRLARIIHLAPWLAMVPVLLLGGCGGNRDAGADLAALAASTASAASADTVKVRALAAAPAAVVNRYDFTSGGLSLYGLHVADGASTRCFDVTLRGYSSEPFVLEVAGAAEVTCTTISTAPGSYSASGQLSLPGMTAVRGTASSCYDVVMNKVNDSPIRLQLTSAADARCAGTSLADPAARASTAGVACALSYSAFNNSAKVQANSSSAWGCSSSLRTLTANGIPDHPVTDGNFATPISVQNLLVNLPLLPINTGSLTAVPVDVGWALNGVKFDPATAGTCVGSATSVAPGGGCVAAAGRDPWRIEALGGSFAFGTDASNAHVQPNGQYHYHGVPEGYLAKLGKGQAVTLVGFAKDGFPIYARYGYSTATEASSAIKVIKGSYAKKSTPDAGRPAVAIFAMGTFTQDYEYVAGSGDLDECNGRFGVTPEFPNGIYHYYITDSYPYIQRCVKGGS